MPTKQELEDYISVLKNENSDLRTRIRNEKSRVVKDAEIRIKELENMPLKESELTLLRQYYKRQME